MSTSPAERRSALGVLLLALLSAQTAQQTLSPLLAPFGRETGLSEVQVGLVMTVAAGTFSVSSLLWGRTVDHWGTRRVLVTGMVIAIVGLLGFAVVANIALAQDTSPTVTWLMMVLTRSLIFGAGMGAIPVAAMAHIAATTEGAAERTRGLGQMGAVQGVALALGPALGALLALGGLLGPVWAAPAVVAIALVVVLRRVPPTGVPVDAVRPVRVQLRPWDPRVRAFLAVGFLMFCSLGMIIIVMGFAFQDRLELSAASTVRHVGFATFCSGVLMVGVQGFLVPRLGWRPARLLRAGLPVACLGLLGLAWADTFATLVIMLALMSLGLGLAMPGYTAGATLQVGPGEQGSVAGLVNAVNGMTFMVGPVAGTALYQVRPELPMLVAAGMCAVAVVLLSTATRFARPATAAADMSADDVTGR
ncbi:MFS transporter [Nocardioides sp.]|uniref:MFS transporter n=1 Tax=Nocardioides sp. TaxID=35761 RepID=UPI002733E5F2|nr:MFS transporter [Nocardioides sp.]MDP3893183.1 MFS transporter [Nocardioides sp.]